MADMIIEYRVMPNDGEVGFETLKSKVEDTVKGYANDIKIIHVKEEPVGFGLIGVNIRFQMNEIHGTDELEKKFEKLDLVGEATVTHMDRL